uniref:Uncharacterized protein n=4 Tax=Vibrio TaxID=662 RepID=A0A0H3ZMM5_9VIBR|nr:hypothetical protein [Vibrio sp. ZF_53]AKN37415.1 hypothetical protein [Vibrio tasmaniensis]AKN39335.1 hypothetical protein [Vibrio sp. ZF_45]AKN39743.1 hypothetical protein [Vibrio splendidus]
MVACLVQITQPNFLERNHFLSLRSFCIPRTARHMLLKRSQSVSKPIILKKP